MGPIITLKRQKCPQTLTSVPTKPVCAGRLFTADDRVMVISYGDYEILQIRIVIIWQAVLGKRSWCNDTCRRERRVGVRLPVIGPAWIVSVIIPLDSYVRGFCCVGLRNKIHFCVLIFWRIIIIYVLIFCLVLRLCRPLFRRMKNTRKRKEKKERKKKKEDKYFSKIRTAYIIF